MSATLTTETTASATIEPLLQRLRARGIKIPRLGEARDYLADYPDVIEFAAKARKMARICS